MAEARSARIESLSSRSAPRPLLYPLTKDLPGHSVQHHKSPNGNLLGCRGICDILQNSETW